MGRRARVTERKLFIIFYEIFMGTANRKGSFEIHVMLCTRCLNIVITPGSLKIHIVRILYTSIMVDGYPAINRQPTHRRQRLSYPAQSANNLHALPRVAGSNLARANYLKN